jgi:hypothetical protein
MGGGGGGSGSLGDTRSLEQRAKEILRQGSTGRVNLFISFAEEDLAEVNLLRGQAKNDSTPLEFNDRSVQEPYDSDRADYIRQRITERIRQCSTTVVYLSPDAAKSKWVDWEVRKSVELGKRVLAVHKGDAPATGSIPPCVTELRIKVLPWSSLAKELGTE